MRGDGHGGRRRWAHGDPRPRHNPGVYQRGGKFAEASERIVPEILIPKQKPDGSFEGQDEGGGKVYTASMAVLALAVKNHFLPIYQR